MSVVWVWTNPEKRLHVLLLQTFGIERRYKSQCFCSTGLFGQLKALNFENSRFKLPKSCPVPSTPEVIMHDLQCGRLKGFCCIFFVSCVFNTSGDCQQQWSPDDFAGNLNVDDCVCFLAKEMGSLIWARKSTEIVRWCHVCVLGPLLTKATWMKYDFDTCICCWNLCKGPRFQRCAQASQQTQVVAVVCVAGAFLASYSKVLMQFGQSKHLPRLQKQYECVRAEYDNVITDCSSTVVLLCFLIWWS